MTIDPRTHDPRAFGVNVTPTDDANAAQDVAEASARALWQRDAAARALGVRVDEVGPGRAVLVVTVRADMLAPHGACHGAYVFALADCCLAYASQSRGRVAVGLSARIEHVAPAEAAERLRAEAVECFADGADAVHDVTITGADGRTIALCRGRSRTTAALLVAGAPEAAT